MFGISENSEMMQLAPDGDTNGVALMLFADNPLANTPSAWSCGDKPEDPQELVIWNEVREVLKALPVGPGIYPNVAWEVHATSYNSKAKLWPFIDKQGGVTRCRWRTSRSTRRSSTS